ncbi:MAG: hypothetical protein FJW34_18830 [Acidobacteria bacterium]|nr:hypothetical protein [Acidobacteriota bacterium]
MPLYSETDTVGRLIEVLAAEREAMARQLIDARRDQLDEILDERFAAIARQVGAELEGVLERAAALPAVPASEDWSALPLEEQPLHLEARRFARVKVAEILVHEMPAVLRGREQADLYCELARIIDPARETFQQDYAAMCPSMRDYLHEELVGTLAQGDAARLGPDYPGAMG